MDLTTSTPFQTVPGDPLGVQRTTLSNGFSLFLSVNRNTPRIHTHISVRAGSKQDPADTTGLAHYMEHMLFKGTSRIGALDWEKEQALLEQIAALYEAHRHSRDPEERKQLYAEIDRLSFEAAKLAAPNEYDKMAGVLGAKGTNAYTWVEQTVYVNDIPSNELERWMLLESERFRMMALRLFHTELETVYEEFNINQDRDFRKVDYALRGALFPKHPYGTQTTMGTAEHLRNPSMVNIQRFFQTYYVPGNMAMVLAGDFDPEEAVALAEKYFGSYEARPVPPFTYEEQPPILQPIRQEVTGKEAPYLMLGWRLGNSRSDDQFMATLVQHMLFNSQAGLLDLRLNQQQLVLESEAWSWMHEDYSVFGLYGKPREDQTLEEVEGLILDVLKAFREGDFPEWLMEAVIRDLKLGEVKAAESNEARVQMMNAAFILGIDWERMARRFAWWETVTKEQVLDFANRHLRADNFVAVYKRQGEDTGVIKVEKPPITAVELSRDGVSEFARRFFELPSPSLNPVFVDFGVAIQQTALSNGLSFHYVRNPNNPLFRLDYIFDFGKNHDRYLALALQYLPYLGAGKFSPQELQIQFFRLGLSFDVISREERSYISLSGLEESLEPGMELVEYILRHALPDEGVLQNLVSDILTERENAKSNRNVILRTAMGSYARFGPDSPFTYRLSKEELKAASGEKLVTHIRELTQYPHRVYYYGQKPMDEVARLLERCHEVKPPFLSPPPLREFAELETSTHEVLFVDFPIVQADVMLMSKGTPHFNLEEHLMRDLYNDYFGNGLSSIVFQEIREFKALAYATYAFYSSPHKQKYAHYLQAYVGTQPDKLPDAIPAMMDILQHMPLVESQIDQARLAILKRIETERILPGDIFWSAQGAQDLGFDRDLREDIYSAMTRMKASDLFEFQQRHVRDRAYTFLVLGSRDRVDLNYLRSFGPVREMGISEVFGY